MLFWIPTEKIAGYHEGDSLLLLLLLLCVDIIEIVVIIYDWSQEVGGQLVSFLSYVSQGACHLWDYMDGSQVIFIRINPLMLINN